MIDRPFNTNFTLLTPDFAVDHDVQVFLRVSTDVSGDGVQADGGILQREARPRAIEPQQAPEEKKTRDSGGAQN